MKLTDLFTPFRRSAKPAVEVAAAREVDRADRVREESRLRLDEWRVRAGPAGSLMAARENQGEPRRD